MKFDKSAFNPVVKPITSTYAWLKERLLLIIFRAYYMKISYQLNP